MEITKLILEESIDTPYVNLDPDTGICDIIGKSYPEDISAFYTQIEDWFEEYTFLGTKDLTINMKLTYFNSASQKVFTQIFEKFVGSNIKVTVNWHYPTEDDEILENGRIYQALTDLKFNFHPY
jgi:hypothetical protein